MCYSKGKENENIRLMFLKSFPMVFIEITKKIFIKFWKTQINIIKLSLKGKTKILYYGKY